MCGICGFVGLENRELIKKMTAILAHRGPDDFGFYFGKDVCLGHRRLSIIDLEKGHQPIFNEDKTMCVVYNGEIYNYLSIRHSLEQKGHRFYTNSDTEAIVHSYEESGEDCVKEFNGMFAFALWDSRKRKLLLARDRLGIKPLYYYTKDNKLYFASETKSLLLTGVSEEIDFEALDSYLMLRYVPHERTMFKAISKLSPASVLTYQNSKPIIKKYWSLEYIKNNWKENDAIEKFHNLLEDSIKLRLMSDVPLGAYLSGGVDSSSIAYLMTRFVSGPIKTFSIGFGTDIDEVERAREISRFLGSEHTELFVEKGDFELLPQIVWNMDEPLGDSIVIPTYILSRETSKKVKVVLTGEGADEILAGYIHHRVMNYIDKYNRFTPHLLKKTVTSLIRKTPLEFMEKFFLYPSKLGTKGKAKLIRYLQTQGSSLNSYIELVSLFSNEEKTFLYTKEAYQKIKEKRAADLNFDILFHDDKTNRGFLDRIIDLDMRNWLPNYTLFKQDKLTMANSLEGRVPYLDYRLVEFCATTRDNFKFRGLSDKYILRKSASRILPDSVAKAKKKAFYFPIEKCFDEKFDLFVRDILNESTIKKRGVFNWDYITTLLAHIRGPELIDNKKIMALLILEIWFRTFIDLKEVD